MQGAAAEQSIIDALDTCEYVKIEGANGNQTNLKVMLTDIENPDKQVVGIIDLCNFDPFHHRAEVGIVIAASYQGQGIGELALSLLKEHSFDFLGIHQLYAYIDVTNEPCRKLFKKCGFEECAYLKDWMRTGKTYRDVVMVQCINS